MVIGNKEFKSQKGAIEYTRAIARKYGSLAYIHGGDDFEYLMALFERHPKSIKKLGCGIRAFKVITNFGGHLAFSIIRMDGTEDDFSFISCVKGKERSGKAYLKEAMRQAIALQVSVFKEYKAMEFKALHPDADGVNDFECDGCKVRINQSLDAHVDHVIEFSRLQEAFIEGRNDIPKIFNDRYHGLKEFRLSDMNFSDEWEKFHGEETIFRILCSVCNSMRLTKNLIGDGKRSLNV